MLEICPTLNPTINLPDSVDKCKTDIKTYLLMQPCYLKYMQIYMQKKPSYTEFEPELLASQVRLRTPWATKQT